MICEGLTRSQSNDLYRGILEDRDHKAMRRLVCEDLFFLLTIACKRKDIDRDWLYERCREVEKNPDGYIDLWAREHYKSTLITYGKSIQDLLADPDNTTIGIFSHTRPNAKGFLEQIKREFEQNTFLKSLFPDVLYENPQFESQKWSADAGIILKRKSNPKEANVEAWGLVDGQPTGKHFKILVYDDVVTLESVSTPDQIKKTTAAWEMSQNLGADGGTRRIIGTRYHANDTYRVIIDRGSAIKRLHAATGNGRLDGDPVFLTRENLAIKRRDMGPYTFGSQMLQDPVADNAMNFKEPWLKFYESKLDFAKWNLYIIVDPANKKKKTNDYTVMEVIGLAPDQNYYLIDAIRDRLNLTQRTTKLIDLHRIYKPKVVGYEQYGMQSDIEHIKYVQEQENYRFNITELGGSLAKEDRIRKLVPIYEQGRFWMPKQHSFVDCEGKRRDYVREFIDDEYLSFPVSVHDDMLDCRARILDPAMQAKFPKPTAESKEKKPQSFDLGSSGAGWLSG